MDRNIMLNYLYGLETNNNREWFHENKEEQQIAVKEFEALIGTLIQELHTPDKQIPLSEPKDLTFKLVRDTRFSHDKSPYLPAFRAHIGPMGKQPVPVGYYLMLRPGNQSFLGGGLFTDVFKDATAMIRDHITAHGDEWSAIISTPDFTDHFQLMGSRLKNVPPGYDPDHPQSEYLKYKSWYLEYRITDQQLTSPAFVEFARDIFLKMRDFNGFLNRALTGFQMPAR